jgi:toxin HigB-1
MNITFAKKKLEKLATVPKHCKQMLGQQMAELFQKRLDDLAAAETLEDTLHLPGNYHQLTGDRAGQWACSLVHPYRLIFIPHEKPLPQDASGRILWIEIKGVEIVEIEDYH